MEDIKINIQKQITLKCPNVPNYIMLTNSDIMGADKIHVKDLSAEQIDNIIEAWASELKRKSSASYREGVSRGGIEI